MNAGFLSLNCGGTNTFTDKNGIVWVPDIPYIFTGSVSQVSASAQQEEPLKSLRFFPGSRKKNCYILPVTPYGTYLLRATFLYGNYNTLGKPPSFDIQFNGNYWSTVSISDANTRVYYELVLAPPANDISVCLAKSTPTDNPFISSLELRQLAPSMYPKVQENKALSLHLRMNFGSVSTDDIRYPSDPFDRIWSSDAPLVNNYIPLTTNRSVSPGITFDKPPSAVMMTARTTANSSLALGYSFSLSTLTLNYYVSFFFAEIATLAPTDARIFNIDLTNDINNASFFGPLNVQQEATAAFTSVEIYANHTSLQGPATFTFRPTSASTLGPIVNAAEIHLVFDSLTSGTDNTDVTALEALKSSFNLTSWTGDPCLPAPYTWDWLDCNNSSPPRVIALRLSNMNLSGTIPPSFSKMTALTDIWLDNNNISGTIPDLSALTNLRTLHLQNNSLTGSIPQSFSQLQHLQELFLQDNDLSGPVPTKLGSTPGLTFRFSGNPNLCLPDNTSCSSTVPLPPSPVGSTAGKKKSNISPVVIGVVIGAVALILIAAFVVFCVRRANVKALERQQIPLSPLSTANTGLMSHKDPPKQTQLYTFEEIRIATQNFQKKIGEGGFGPVYFGCLADGQEVAVKMLSSTSNQGKKEFFNEVDLLSRVHHKNLVSLIGYCYESKEQILVYEYMPNGTLRENLYGSMVSKRPLDWKTRLSIALNAAQGLEYLHTGCSPAIIHRDVKSNNILLNKKLMAKVADFGLSKLAPEEGATHISTMVKGTAGYLDPEYYITNQLTEKSDVYSFGVVLLEIICGRQPINPQLSRPELNLVEWARPFLQEGRIHDIADPALRQNYNTEAMWKVAEIAMMSAELHGVNRPTMNEVVNDLKEAIHLEKGTAAPISDANAASPFSANQAQVFPRPHRGPLDHSSDFASRENSVVEGR
ncbi:hypothetical protein O6H91_02G118300 [Diphasiastrum complanatum]|uniref:Uncharacterized protein n=1 Tax=Diphasiastrum complanatum TaxID=34168 RepID=A0ACC2EJW1_DIPCM|nr:hypothetical protein O6H91_02G118300 [Diphasiastrum complanatum]